MAVDEALKVLSTGVPIEHIYSTLATEMITNHTANGNYSENVQKIEALIPGRT
jgi:hypothetical protein